MNGNAKDNGFATLAEARIHAQRRLRHLEKGQVIYESCGRYFVDTLGRSYLGRAIETVKA